MKYLQYERTDKVEEPAEEDIQTYYNSYDEDDKRLYEELRRPFYPDPDSVNGHWGKHSVRIAKEICEIVDPTNILEIGFNMGHSTCFWMMFSRSYILSVDISMHPNTLFAAGVCSMKYEQRFQFLNSSSFNLKSVGGKLYLKDEPDLRQCDDAFKFPRKEPFLYHPYGDMFREFDMVFIDGDHLYDSVKNDTELALALKPKWIVFDDLWKCWGPSVMDVINEKGLKIYKRWGNVGLVKL